MDFNVGGVILLILGALAVLVGVQGSQGKVWSALTGKTPSPGGLTPGQAGPTGVGSMPYSPPPLPANPLDPLAPRGLGA
ncbi:MAG TPA: hypothetical protein VGH66_01450 [Acidimicrobiales bacterium]